MPRRKISKKERIRQRRLEALEMLGVAFVFVLIVFLTTGRNTGAAERIVSSTQYTAAETTVPDASAVQSASTEAEEAAAAQAALEEAAREAAGQAAAPEATETEEADQTIPEETDTAEDAKTKEEEDIAPSPTPSPEAEGWHSTKDGWYYVNAEGSTLTSQWETIEGRRYYFGEDGYMLTGWNTIDGRRCQLSLGGELLTNTWTYDEQGNACHLNKDGAIDTGWLKTDEGTYYLGDDGVMRIGKLEVGGASYYFGSDGRMTTGWATIDDTKYHFDKNGALSTGFFKDEDGSIYYFNSDGTMAHSWLELDGKKYFPGEDGILDIGWTQIDGDRYYFLEDGAMAVGEVTIDGQTYTFGDDGQLAIGLTSQNGKLYYYDDSGVKKTGIVHLNEGTYYFGGSDGSAQSGWVTDDAENRYYMDETTFIALTGWRELNGKMYFFSSEGIYDPSKKESDVPTVALTFDDGPGYYTDRLLDILVANDATATFFMIGQEIELYKDQVKREYELGMEQAVHTYHHKNLRNLSADEIRKELGDTFDLLEEVTGHRPTLWRPPGGAYDDTVLANDFGCPVILWSLDTLDWETKDTQSSVDAVLDNVKDGDIILMHEIYQASVDAVEIFLPRLKERGFRVVSVSELAEAKGVALVEDTAYGRID